MLKTRKREKEGYFQKTKGDIRSNGKILTKGSLFIKQNGKNGLPNKEISARTRHAAGSY